VTCSKPDDEIQSFLGFDKRHHIAKLGRVQDFKTENIMCLLKEDEFGNEPSFLYTFPSLVSPMCTLYKPLCATKIHSSICVRRLYCIDWRM